MIIDTDNLRNIARGDRVWHDDRALIRAAADELDAALREIAELREYLGQSRADCEDVLRARASWQQRALKAEADRNDEHDAVQSMADEIDELRAAVGGWKLEVTDGHTTHHYDCGCLTASYEAQVTALRAENATQASAIAAVREALLEGGQDALTRSTKALGILVGRYDQCDEQAAEREQFCKDCGRRVPDVGPGSEYETSGLCQVCLNGPVLGPEPEQLSEGSSKTPGKLGGGWDR